VDLQQACTTAAIINNIYLEEESSSYPIDFAVNTTRTFDLVGMSSGISNFLGKDNSVSSLIVFAGGDSNDKDHDNILAMIDESSSNPLNFDES